MGERATVAGFARTPPPPPCTIWAKKKGVETLNNVTQLRACTEWISCRHLVGFATWFINSVFRRLFLRPNCSGRGVPATGIERGGGEAGHFRAQPWCIHGGTRVQIQAEARMELDVLAARCCDVTYCIRENVRTIVVFG